ncbi:MAG TPA: sulfatase-like hydrolase/transferase, partial [Candidatus Acidoferrales bacterium]|nr:sulfatase-like hydrolase/transferase [Candidatus Acidoferrales bacterium]
GSGTTNTFAQASPNVLVLMTDDQRQDTANSTFMPQLTSRIHGQGITFTRAYMSTALCQPSRAAFFTGRYARNNTVATNADPIPPTETPIANDMQAAGYYTIHVGKYLNTFRIGDPCPTGYNFFFGNQGAGVPSYFDPTLVDSSCTWNTYPGYITDTYRDQAIAALKQVPAGTPFYMEWTTNAPHAPAQPDIQDANLYSNLPPNRPPNFNPASWPMGGKPGWLTNTAQLTPDQIANDVDTWRLNQLRCLASVDRAIGAILDELTAEGKLDSTLILYWSDNGYLWGSQRLIHKNRVYEEASHFDAMAIRYPPLVSTTPVVDSTHLVQVIDMTATIYAVTGVPHTGQPLDGQSLVPLFSGGPGTWRDALLLEGWPGNGQANGYGGASPDAAVHYQAMRCSQCAAGPSGSSGEFVYVETVPDPAGLGRYGNYVTDTPELYDLGNDPYEMNNLVNDPNYASVVSVLHNRLINGPF